ncbi:hypothetical protein H4Q26_005599 [Puccinia striiformis f. sp. tritici PST-130]|nr:hypothetical protein H4Q26_005599 [Puccinia striiformis f. sp. tritici PST-130]
MKMEIQFKYDKDLLLGCFDGPKFAKEVYKPSNRLLPPNKRLWGSENVNDVSEDTASSKEIQQASKQAPALKKGKSKVKEESESKAKESQDERLRANQSNSQTSRMPRRRL